MRNLSTMPHRARCRAKPVKLIHTRGHSHVPSSVRTSRSDARSIAMSARASRSNNTETHEHGRTRGRTRGRHRGRASRSSMRSNIAVEHARARVEHRGRASGRDRVEHRVEHRVGIRSSIAAASRSSVAVEHRGRASRSSSRSTPRFTSSPTSGQHRTGTRGRTSKATSRKPLIESEPATVTPGRTARTSLSRANLRLTSRSRLATTALNMGVLAFDQVDDPFSAIAFDHPYSSERFARRAASCCHSASARTVSAGSSASMIPTSLHVMPATRRASSRSLARAAASEHGFRSWRTAASASRHRAPRVAVPPLSA